MALGLEVCMAQRNATRPGKAAARQALDSIGRFLFRAMYLDEEIDFSASTKRLPDRSMIVTVVHPSGTFQFNVPAEERAAVAARMRQEGGGQEGF